MSLLCSLLLTKTITNKKFYFLVTGIRSYLFWNIGRGFCMQDPKIS